MTSDLLQRGKHIKLAIFDVDGVLTDGRLYFLEDGSEFKTFNTLDGQGVAHDQRGGGGRGRCQVQRAGLVGHVNVEVHFGGLGQR